MREADIKLLWGRAASRCAICRVELTQNAKATGSQFLIGEHAHIVGDKPGSARYKISLTPEERDRYHNRILLCPNHHTEIDKNEAEYPIERLYQIKTDHELWVQNSLGAAPTQHQQAEQLAYAILVDAAVESCRLRTWQTWTSSALAPIPTWPIQLPDESRNFAARVLGAVLPGRYPSLERAISTLARAVHEAARYFLRHAEPDEQEDVWRAVQFYKHLGRWDPVAYKQLSEEYDSWAEECYALVILATKAANWFAEEVRRSLNPFFFLEEGKFLITHGPFFDLSFSTELHEFTDDEKKEMPVALLRRVRERDEARGPFA